MLKKKIIWSYPSQQWVWKMFPYTRHNGWCSRCNLFLVCKQNGHMWFLLLHLSCIQNIMSHVGQGLNLKTILKCIIFRRISLKSWFTNQQIYIF